MPMDKTTTLNSLSHFTQHEAELLRDVGLKPAKTSQQGPKKETVDFILNFSKSYSIRKSEKIGKIETLLN